MRSEDACGNAAITSAGNCRPTTEAHAKMTSGLQAIVVADRGGNGRVRCDEDVLSANLAAIRFDGPSLSQTHSCYACLLKDRNAGLVRDRR